jgi:uncharacterized protein YjbI with pentapeptide repeats
MADEHERRTMKRLRVFFKKFQSTDNLLAQVRNNGNQSALAALEALKERVAHQDGTLQNLDLSGANLSKATLAASDLQAVDFSGAKLGHAYFLEANLQKANFNKAQMIFANFRAANLRGASFKAALLENANFSRADLGNVNLQNANLRQANFWRTNLKGANLTDANLVDASLSDVICDETTILPDGEAWSENVAWTHFTGN